MRKLSLLVLVAVLLGVGIYTVLAYADKSGNDAINTTDQAAVLNIEQNTDHAVQNSKHPGCPSDCGHTGNCTKDCPNFADKNGDGKCDRQGACRTDCQPEKCPGHANGGCGKH